MGQVATGHPGVGETMNHAMLQTRELWNYQGLWTHFSDASQDRAHCSFVIGKARVSPLRQVTIPKMELTAATVSARRSKLLKNELPHPDAKGFFWTDSKIVLGYVNSGAKRFHVFVANRMQQIREVTDPSSWLYVDTTVNPADEVSRGVTARHLLGESRWLIGLHFSGRTVGFSLSLQRRCNWMNRIQRWSMAIPWLMWRLKCTLHQRLSRRSAYNDSQVGPAWRKSSLSVSSSRKNSGTTQPVIPDQSWRRPCKRFKKLRKRYSRAFKMNISPKRYFKLSAWQVKSRIGRKHGQGIRSPAHSTS